MGLEKDRVVTMTNANFIQQARDALIPMRKATVDALLLGSFIAVILIYTAIVLTYPWLIILAYALAYLLAVVLRLHQAARETTEARNPYNYLFH